MPRDVLVRPDDVRYKMAYGAVPERPVSPGVEAAKGFGDGVVRPQQQSGR